MTYLLDSDTCIYALKGNPKVLAMMRSKSRSEIVVSVISEGELRTGAHKSSAPEKALNVLESFLAPLDVLEFTSDDAAAYALIRSRLERAGTPIGPLDTLIAAQAVARQLTVVSNNGREFSRVPGLRLESWA